MSQNFKISILAAIRLNAVDKIFLIHNATVLGLILFFGRQRPDLWGLIGWHLALTFLVIALAGLSRVSSNPVIHFLRATYAGFLIPFVHHESGVLSLLVMPEYLDPFFVKLDRFLFGGDLYAQFAPALNSFLANELMNGFYFWLYLMIIGVTMSTYFLRRQRIEELMFALTLCMYAHYLFFILVPAVGPTHLRAELFAGQEGLFGPLVYYIIERGDTPGGAFPSSHCAGAVVLTWYAWRIFGRRVGWALLPGTILLSISTVYLSMHYAVDTVAGIITGILFALYVPQLYRRLSNSAVAYKNNLANG